MYGQTWFQDFSPSPWMVQSIKKSLSETEKLGSNMVPTKSAEIGVGGITRPCEWVGSERPRSVPLGRAGDGSWTPAPGS